ncbi:MAG: polysaccharide pyruvyl transferase family protein [Nitrososphaeraceae archaeon]
MLKKSRNDGETVVSGKNDSIYYCFVIGNYGNYNIGDEILLKEIVYRFSSKLHEQTIFFVPTRNPNFVDKYHKELRGLLKPISLFNPAEVFKGLIRSKLIIVGGGGIWSRYTGNLARFIPIVVLFARAMRKRTCYESIGMYSTASKMQRFLVNLSILFVDECSVRDLETLDMIWKSSRARTILVDDLSLPYIRRNQNRDSNDFQGKIKEYSYIMDKRNKGKLIIGLSLKAFISRDLTTILMSEVSTAINSLSRKYGDRLYFVFFPFAETNSISENDLFLVNDILKGKKNANENFLIIDHTHPLLWFTAIRDLVDIFIGMRYHSVIFTLAARKPLLCIPYENKVKQVLISKNKDSAIICVISPEELSSHDIINFVEGHIRDW